jgi:acetyl esterase/lipase
MSLRYDPEFEASGKQILLGLAATPRPAVHDWETRRATIAAMAQLSAHQAPEKDPSIEQTSYEVKSFDGASITVFRFAPKEAASAPGPAILHAHGGGMIAGGAEMFAHASHANAAVSGVQYFSVEYRLAPEHKHPTPVEDVYAALIWLRENAEKFNVDRARIAVEGESAGGGLAAAVALMARDGGLQPPLAKQILIYPMLDARTIKTDAALDKFLTWSADCNITGWHALLGNDFDGSSVSPYASAAYAKDLSGLPSTYIDVGGLDLFLQEDLAYASNLAKAHVEVELHVYPGLPHGFEGFAPQISSIQRAFANRIKARQSF